MSNEIIKNGKYRVFNGTAYETIHLQTTASQVIESEEKKFVSQAEKDTWNSKANGSHIHDDRYYQKSETYTQAEVDEALNGKANTKHTHAATEITTDNSNMFVSKAEKDRWNDTYTKTEVDSKINAAKIEVNSNVDGVQSNLDEAVQNLTQLINTGGTANEKLAARVTAIENTKIPEVKKSVTDLDSKFTGLTTSLQSTKADKVHKHAVSDITGLGTAATRNVGIASGNIPVLDSNGKLAESVLPKIAINEVFTAHSVEEAMGLKMENGDILVLNVSEASVSGLSKQYTEYIKSGKLTYLCVNIAAVSFEERFKPLQSQTDSITAAEVEAKLALKVNVSDFNSYKGTVQSALNGKANINEVYTKGQADNLLNNKVDKVQGKGLSTNDFTTELLNKLNGIEAGANRYVHPSGDGNLHIPSTGVSNNGKVLMAGSTAGSVSWTQLTSNNISTTSEKQFVSASQIATWNGKAEANHSHSQYRLISDSLSAAETRAEIAKLKTIISTTAPQGQMTGAIWIEELK